MKIKIAEDVPAETVEMEGASARAGPPARRRGRGAPNFYMRMFTLAPGGHTPRHTHAWEHEMYVLSGSGLAVTPDGELPVRAGQCIYVAPGDDHQFRNTSDDELKFLCLVPK